MVPRTVLRGLLARRTTTTIIRTARRNASSHTSTSTGPTSKSSDLPWLIGSVGITVPAAYYLLSSSPVENKGHHATGHDANLSAGAMKDKATSLKDQATSAASSAMDKASAAAGSAKDKASDLTSSKSKSEKAFDAAKEKSSDVVDTVKEKASAAKDKASDLAESAKEKASGAADSAKETVDEATAGTEGGETHKKKAYDTDAKTDNPASKDPGNYAGSTEVGGEGTMSGKQRGLSNDDTQHALLHTDRGEAIKKKGEETMHESAKAKGTVDANRPIK